MSEGAAREKVSQALFKAAVGARDAGPLIKRLGEINVDNDRVVELASLIRRAGALILQRPNAGDQASRDGFLTDLRDALVVLGPPAVELENFDLAVTAVFRAEEGHFRILGALDRCEISAHPAEARLSAGLTQGELRLTELQTLIQEALASGAQFSIPGGVTLTDGNGQPRSPDALMTSVVEGLGGFLKMEGYKGGFFTKAGLIELPALPDASGEDLQLYFPCERLGMIWQRWELLHQKARFGDQSIDLLAGDTLPESCPSEVTEVFTRRSDVNFVDWAANERALDREGLSHRDLVTTTNVEAKAKGILGPVAALPAEWITDAEVAQALSLSEALGFEIAADTALHGGLRLTEWVRGYCALAAWVDTRSKTADPLLRTSRDELVELLTRLSFTESQADIFLDAVSFGRKSRDLWDAPIVRTKTDWLVVSAGVHAQRLAKIVPSLLASKDVQIKRKGLAFEARVLGFLRGQGLDARAVTVKRDGAEYQYDALVHWGDKLLLLECKNKGLSGNDPVQAYHFVLGLEEDIEQVHRLVRGLETWPEIVTDAFGPSAAGLTLVPILLQNETFQIAGPIDGVYVYDWSALSRFFEAPFYRWAHQHQIAPHMTFSNRVAVKRIWANEAPSADDLIAEMTDPLQIKLLDRVSQIVPSVFSLDETTMVWDWSIIRHPTTLEDYAAACGVDPASIIARLKEVDDAYRAAKARGFQAERTKLGKRARRRRAGRAKGNRR